MKVLSINVKVPEGREKHRLVKEMLTLENLDIAILLETKWVTYC